MAAHKVKAIGRTESGSDVTMLYETVASQVKCPVSDKTPEGEESTDKWVPLDEVLNQYADEINENTTQNIDFAKKLNGISASMEAYAKQKSRSATVVVAASNSKNKESADFIVPKDAVNAQETIAAALNACPDNGRVVLLEGLYICNAMFNISSSKTLEGQGDGTLLKLTSPFTSDMLILVPAFHTGVVKNMMIEGMDIGAVNGVGYSNHTILKMYNVTIQNFGGSGVYPYASMSSNGVLEMIGCHILDNGEYGLHLLGAYGEFPKIIVNNTFEGNRKKAVNSYPNIELIGIGYTSYCPGHMILMGNFIRSRGVSKYGINGAFGHSVIADNNLFGAGVTASLSIQNQVNCAIGNNLV